MRELQTSTSSRRPASKAPGYAPIVPFTGQEKRAIFKGMVVAELEAGFLRYSRRQALMDYAAKLGIPEFDACLLIAEAQYRSNEIEPVHFDAAATLDNLTRPETWSVSLRLALALVTAAFLDLLAIYWLFG